MNQKTARRKRAKPEITPRLAAREATTTHILISGRENYSGATLPRTQALAESRRNTSGAPPCERLTIHCASAESM